MTIGEERLRALVQAREFMKDLLDPKFTPRVPRDVRKQALRVLRHYPLDYELEKLPKALPGLFGPLTFGDETLQAGPPRV